MTVYPKGGGRKSPPRYYPPIPPPIQQIEYVQINTGTINPNGVVIGRYGDLYHNTSNDDVYVQTTKPRGSTWILIATSGSYLGIVKGNGNPNGVLIGNFGWFYRDILNNIMYQCVSDPSGDDWEVV